jgi:hypothetical protein
MLSERQLNANRRNALRSTGPRTPEGKTRVSENARRHGLLARETVLPDEDRQQYLNLLAALEADHQPAGPLEEFCVRQMASAQWRLARLVRIETGFFATEVENLRPNQDATDAGHDPHDRTTRLLGTAFKQGSAGDPVGKLCRYEGTLQRSFYKALESLRAAQARRRVRNQTKPIPISDTRPKPRVVLRRCAASPAVLPFTPRPVAVRTAGNVECSDPAQLSRQGADLHDQPA